MPDVRFSLRIPREKWLDYYNGVASDVIATAENGKTISFPARVLRPYVSHSGVYGNFVITYDILGKFHSIRKV